VISHLLKLYWNLSSAVLVTSRMNVDGYASETRSNFSLSGDHKRRR
jgi:hypothetical protein